MQEILAQHSTAMSISKALWNVAAVSKASGIEVK